MFVRLAIDTDLPELLAMARANCEETHAGEEYAEHRSRALFQAYMDGVGNPTFFVAEGRGRKLVGFVMARWLRFDYRDGFYAQQSVLYVSPENRGSRASVLLMKFFIAWSQRIGAAAILGGNDNRFKSERTAKFLEHFGFEQTGIFLRKRLL